MTLEHPYKNIYLDQQFRAQRRPRRRPQAFYRRPLHEVWLGRLLGAALLTGAACSLLLALLLAGGMIWLIARVVQEFARWLGG